MPFFRKGEHAGQLIMEHADEEPTQAQVNG